MTRTTRLLRRVTGVAFATVIAGSTALLAAPSASAAITLNGTFQLTPGSCGGSGASGTYLRMILPSGTPSGPFMSNSDSTCHDQSITPLSPGVDGGLVTGSYQSPPSPPFDSSGNARAKRITAPAQFYGTAFATGTTPVDAQTHVSVPAPHVTVSGSHLSADLRAFSVTWNNQYFNQGAPKPDGSYPGNTRAATGTYDASTGAFTLQWTSQVVGGPFDKFTGLWHLQGRFVAAGGGTGSSSGHGAGAATAAAATAPRGGTGIASTTAGGAVVATTPTGTETAAGVLPAAANGPGGGQSLAASTRTIVHDGWHAQWWLVALVILLAVGGFGALFVLNRSIRRAAAS